MNGSNKDFYGAHSKETIAELLEKTADGSQDALLELKAIYTPLIESRISKHYLPEMSRQDNVDLREEAFISFCNAACNYDAAYSEVDFGLYAKICIENALNSYVRSYLRRMKSPVVSLDRADGGESQNFLQKIVDEENAAELITLIRGKLSDYENRVWWMYVSGMSASEITESLGIQDARSVSNAIYRIRKKLKGLLHDKNNF